MKNIESHYYNNSDIGYCDTEWMEIEEIISQEIIKELDIINSEFELEEDEQQA